jgi:hypothetical protein
MVGTGAAGRISNGIVASLAGPAMSGWGWGKDDVLDNSGEFMGDFPGCGVSVEVACGGRKAIRALGHYASMEQAEDGVILPAIETVLRNPTG